MLFKVFTGRLDLLHTLFLLFLLFLFLYFILRDSKTNLFLLYILPFLAGGFSETFAVAQLVFITFILFLNRKYKILAGFLGSLSSLVLVVLAPGNEARRDSATQVANLNTLASRTIIETINLEKLLLTNKVLLVSLILIFGIVFMFAYKSPYKVIKPRNIYLYAIYAALTYLTVNASIIATSIFAISQTPPNRVISIVIINTFLVTITEAYFIASLVRQKLNKDAYKKCESAINITIFFLVILLIKPAYQKSINNYLLIKIYASEWDRINEEVNRSKKANIIVSKINSIAELDSLRDDPTFWVNDCVAKYYNLGSIRTKDN